MYTVNHFEEKKKLLQFIRKITELFHSVRNLIEDPLLQILQSLKSPSKLHYLILWETLLKTRFPSFLKNPKISFYDKPYCGPLPLYHNLLYNLY